MLRMPWFTFKNKSRAFEIHFRKKKKNKKKTRRLTKRNWVSFGMAENSAGY